MTRPSALIDLKTCIFLGRGTPGYYIPRPWRFGASSSAASGLHPRPVVERRIKLAASLWRQVHQIPNRTQLINAALLDVFGQPGMATVKMAQRAIVVSREN